MLPQIYRLTYQEFFQNRAPRRIYHSLNFDLTVKSSKESGAHFVISISKSIDKRSSYRNRSKRIISESLREVIPQIKIDVDILIKSKKIIKKEEKQYIVKELIMLLGKAGILELEKI